MKDIYDYHLLVIPVRRYRIYLSMLVYFSNYSNLYVATLAYLAIENFLSNLALLDAQVYSSIVFRVFCTFCSNKDSIAGYPCCRYNVLLVVTPAFGGVLHV